MKLPMARTSDIIEQDLGSELLIYDLRINKAYSLNNTSKTVLAACNEQMSFDDLKRRYGYTDDLIHLALQELSASNLLEDYRSSHFGGMSRREVIRKVGLATMTALPLIASITAPKAIHAASNLPAPDMCEEVECPYAQTQCQNDGFCDENTGDCVISNKAAGTPCDDGSTNTINDACDGSGNCIGVACPGGQVNCGFNICVDLQNDPENCGNCGYFCSGGGVCSGGICKNV